MSVVVNLGEEQTSVHQTSPCFLQDFFALPDIPILFALHPMLICQAKLLPGEDWEAPEPYLTTAH